MKGPHCLKKHEVSSLLSPNEEGVDSPYPPPLKKEREKTYSREGSSLFCFLRYSSVNSMGIRIRIMRIDAINLK